MKSTLRIFIEALYCNNSKSFIVIVEKHDQVNVRLQTTFVWTWEILEDKFQFANGFRTQSQSPALQSYKTF
jgi:hypothetical protein